MRSFLDRLLDALVLPVSKLYERREDVLPEDGVDCVVGFGIGMRADGQASQLSAAVARRCAGLYKAGLAQGIIFTGGASENNVTEAEAMRSVALEMDVPEDKIFIEEFSRNTRQNSVNTVALMERHDPDSGNKNFNIATVGHFFHARRCQGSFKKAAPRNWQVFGFKAYSPWDPECTQKRLHAEWKFVLWEMPMFILFKLLRWA